MKPIAVCALTVMFVFALSSCGEKFEEMKNAAEAMKNAPQAVEEINKSADLMQKRAEERKQRGDTLAIHYKELQKYLPQAPSGYTADAPSGQSTNMPGYSFSEATVHFSNGNDAIDVKLVDYNQAFGLYQGMTSLWALGMSIDNDTETQKGYTPGIEYVSGWEKFAKQTKRAELFLGVGGRFYLEITATGQNNTDFVKDLAKSMKLKELSLM